MEADSTSLNVSLMTTGSSEDALGMTSMRGDSPTRKEDPAKRQLQLLEQLDEGMDDNFGGVRAIKDGRNILFLTSTNHTIENLCKVMNISAKELLHRVGEDLEGLKVTE